MHPAIVINTKLKFISFLVFLVFENYLAYAQIIESLFNATSDISISQTDTTKSGVFIFVNASSSNPNTNKLLTSLILLEISEELDNSNFEIYLIKITSNNSICSNKSLSLNEYELPSFFNYDPFYTLIYPSKTYGELLNERVDSALRKTISIAPNIKSMNSPFLHFKDYHSLINLIKNYEYAKNYQALKLQYDQLQEKLLFMQNQIDSVARIFPILHRFQRLK